MPDNNKISNLEKKGKEYYSYTNIIYEKKKFYKVTIVNEIRRDSRKIDSCSIEKINGR